MQDQELRGKSEDRRGTMSLHWKCVNVDKRCVKVDERRVKVGERSAVVLACGLAKSH